ncbi:MAG: VapC toxin family PIN domain ribonuclease [Acidobacteria bacterium]|nr:MAG: VapC toxin family PIN domain ribonuclease [Acidobacteriota bacterium]
MPPSEARPFTNVKLLLDTSVLIDVLRRRNGRRELLAELVRAGHTLSTTALNIAEVYAGMRPGETAPTEAFLGELECHDLTGSGARLAGKLKNEWRQKSRTLTLADTVVAAIAMERKCLLFTDNRKDFPMPEVKLYPRPEGY